MTPDATALEQLAALLASFLATPDMSELQAAFMFGLTTPLQLYVVAYLVGLLINFWRN